MLKLFILVFSCAALQAQILIPVTASKQPSGGSSVATPTDSPGAGTYTLAQLVTLSESTSGATICYRTDGTNPAATTPGTCDAGSSTYASSFSVGATTTVRALGTKAGLTNSSILTSLYTINPPGGSISATFHSSTDGSCTNSAGTSCTTSSFAVTTGDLIVCYGAQTAAATLQALSVTDSASNSYSSLAAARTNGTKASGQMFLAVAGSSTSITATISNVNGTNAVAGTCLALTPSQLVTVAVDQATNTTFDSTTSMVSGSTGSTTNSNDIVLSGFAILNDTAGGTITKGGSYDINNAYSNGKVLAKADAYLQWKNVTSTGAQTGGATNSVSVSGAGHTVALKASMVAVPTDSPGSGSYGSTQTVTLSDSTGSSTICYRTDGVDPTAPTPGTCGAGSTTYSTGFSVAATATVKAIGTRAGFNNSSVLSSTYTITGGGAVTYSAPDPTTGHCYNDSGSGTTTHCTLGATPAAGSLVTVTIFSAFGLTATVADNAANNYTKTPASPSAVNDASAGSESIFYFVANGSAGNDITVTLSGSGISSITVDNWGVTGGTPSFDQDVAGNGTTGTTINTPTVAGTGSGRLLIAAAASENGVTGVNSPWTAEAHGVGTFGEETAYILSGSSQATNLTQSSGHWDTIGAAFK